MADASVLVLNDVLCFVKNKFCSTQAKQLRDALVDFYSVDALSEAKVRLLNDVDAMQLTRKHPHIPLRRTGVSRLGLEADDLFSMFTFLDDVKAIDQLPTYVSNSPDNMPNLRLYEGDMHVVLSLLKSMDGRMIEFESAMAAIIRDVKAIQTWPPLPDPSRPPPVAGQPRTHTRTGTRDINTTEPAEGVRRSAVSQPSQCSIQPTNQVGNSAAAVSLPPAGDHPVRDWAAAAVSTPYGSANRFAVLGSTTTDDDDDPQRAFVHPRRNLRRRRRSSPELSTQNQPRSNAQQKRRGPPLLGKAKNGSFISAARKQRKKTVLCVDNVNTACSVEQITAFIRSLSVNVLTCFEVKPRRRYDESEDDVRDKTAFRVCIYADELDQLLAAEAWPEHVSVSSWFSKPRANSNVNSNDNVDNKRVRLGNGHDVEQCTRQVLESNAEGGYLLLSLQSINNQINPVDPTTASAACLQSPVGDDDDTIITSQDDNVEVREDVMMCVTNDGE